MRLPDSVLDLLPRLLPLSTIYRRPWSVREITGCEVSGSKFEGGLFDSSIEVTEEEAVVGLFDGGEEGERDLVGCFEGFFQDGSGDQGGEEIGREAGGVGVGVGGRGGRGDSVGRGGRDVLGRRRSKRGEEEVSSSRA